MSKIMIAIPCMDQVPAPFALSLAMIRKPEEDEFACATRMGSLIYNSRNDLARQAIAAGFDWVFWLDSDMVFGQDILIKMMDVARKNNLDFLSGLYFRRTQPFTPVAFDHLEVNENGDCEWSDFEELPQSLFEVGGCGFGCVLIKTDVLAAVHEKYVDMFMPIAHMGEDLSFCWRARQLGYKIFMDPNITLGHVGYSVINRNFYESYKRAAEREEELNENSD